MFIDAHQHFWQYNPRDYTWMSDDMGVLKRDFLPADLAPLLDSIGFDGSVVVQASQTTRETDWLIELADANDIIKGIVGWVDLRSPTITDDLAKYAANPKFKGVRHIVHDEPDDNFMLLPEFQRGISELKSFGLTYDLLLRPRHIPAAIQLVQKFPDQPFVVDHIAKPLIQDHIFSPWESDFRELATYENVLCKLSGMVTEADWANWKPADIHPYVDVAVDAFGTDRLMIGSDWPVATLCGDYKTVMKVVIDYLRELLPGAQSKILGNTCARFYNIT
jgi:L-fuconolactonase